MTLNRRQWLCAALASTAAGADEKDPPRTVPEYERPLFNLKAQVRQPVQIASIELLRNGKNYFVRTRSADGATGLIKTKDIEDYIPILMRRVIPAFVGKDARDLESLVDEVYIKHYKLAGQPFWCPVAFVEQSLWDLLGKTIQKPAGELMGGVIRKEIPVYLSGSGRELTAEREVDIYIRGIKETGAKAFKLKIGGRMSRNADAYPGRTRTTVTLARKLAGDGIALMADANGSYDSKIGIEVGRMLQDLKYSFYEEPCPWEEVSETKRVADALTIPVAGGEQDSSLWKFHHMIENRVVKIVQPDLNYNGGFMRSARVARMAREAKMHIVPHNTQTEASGFNILQFASAIPNIGPYMEYPWRGDEKPASWYTPRLQIRNGVIKVPTGAGLGVEFDPDYIKQAQRVEG